MVADSGPVVAKYVRCAPQIGTKVSAALVVSLLDFLHVCRCWNTRLDADWNVDLDWLRLSAYTSAKHPPPKWFERGILMASQS